MEKYYRFHVEKQSNSLIDPLGNNSHNTIPLGLSFDDVLLIPNQTSVVSRKDSDTSTYLSKRIPLSIPIVSSNMDTVTEAEMAITMAREGGIGIIHRFMSAEEQIEQVLKVKRSESILIEKPYTLPITSKLGDAWRFLEKKAVSGILIIDDNHKLQGILTSRDIEFEEIADTPVSEIMTKNPITAPQGIDIQDAKQILKQNKIEKLPVVDNEGILTGLITMKDIKKSKMWPQATKDGKGRLMVGAAIGVKKGFLERAEALYNAECDVIVIDIAHGHSISVIDTIKQLRIEFGNDQEIIAGNVATAQGTAELISHGADGIKVGVGPGSICITRIVSGAGVPQLTAIQSATSVAHDEKIPLIADGGIKTSGDIAKAIGIGASTVMLGNLLAGTSESPGFPVLRNGRRVKIIRGMASLGASLGRDQRVKGSFGDEEDLISMAPEGVEAVVPYRGQVKDVLNQLVSGLRSGMSYIGAKTVNEMWDKSNFIRITSAGKRESQSHDVDKL
jgi:IMP dehydrogenase